MERVVVIMEYPNINRPASDRGIRIDYGELLTYVTAGRFLVEAFCYVPIDPRNPSSRDHEIKKLRLMGWHVQTKVGKANQQSYKCNFDVEITLELMHIAERIKPDTIVMASGDIDFIPVVSEMRRRGIRVEIASFPESVSEDLVLHSSGYINLEQWIASANEVGDEPSNPLEMVDQNDELGENA
jgi:uncharacterized LabA/DUF88 family protein